MDSSWVTDLLSVIENALKNDGKITFKLPNGDEVTEVITLEIYQLLVKNQHMLIKIGLMAFSDFLKLKSEGRDLEALEKIYSQLSVQELVDLATANAIQMELLAKQIQETRKFWVDFALQVGVKLATGLLGALLI